MYLKHVPFKKKLVRVGPVSIMSAIAESIAPYPKSWQKVGYNKIRDAFNQ